MAALLKEHGGIEVWARSSRVLKKTKTGTSRRGGFPVLGSQCKPGLIQRSPHLAARMVHGASPASPLARDHAKAHDNAPGSPRRGMSNLGHAADELVKRQQDIERQRNIAEARKTLDERYLNRTFAAAQARAEEQKKFEQDEVSSRQQKRLDFLYRASADSDEEDVGGPGGSFIPQTEQGAGPWSWLLDIPQTWGCGECCLPSEKKDGALGRWVSPRAFVPCRMLCSHL